MEGSLVIAALTGLVPGGWDIRTQDARFGRGAYAMLDFSVLNSLLLLLRFLLLLQPLRLLLLLLLPLPLPL